MLEVGKAKDLEAVSHEWGQKTDNFFLLYNRYSDNSIEINIKNRLQVPFKGKSANMIVILKKQSGKYFENKSCYLKVLGFREPCLGCHFTGYKDCSGIVAATTDN